jgi:hypothetical protein
VWVEDEKTAFEHAWESNPMTSSTPVAFPTHLGEVEELAKWVRKQSMPIKLQHQI